jgi:hypothetical protein
VLFAASQCCLSMLALADIPDDHGKSWLSCILYNPGAKLNRTCCSFLTYQECFVLLRHGLAALSLFTHS